MNWVDVCGPPGVGKSTLCDPLWHSQQRFDDGKLPPADWQAFLDEITRLFGLIRPHWSFVPAIRMNRRSARKMATVARKQFDGPYIQTGFAQRGLGFGWRLNQMGADLDAIRPFFELMPVSLGVAVLTAPVDVIQARNEERLNARETAHENRAFMVPLMTKPLEIALDVLGKRGVPILEIDATGDIDGSRRQLVEFATARSAQSAPAGHCRQGTVLRPPPWWG